MVYGDFGINHVMKDSLKDKKILDMMKKLYFEVDAELDSKFPQKRICRAELYTKDGRVYISDNCEPRGEAFERVSVSWLCEKFERITGPFVSKENQKQILSLVTDDINLSVREFVDTVNNLIK